MSVNVCALLFAFQLVACRELTQTDAYNSGPTDTGTQPTIPQKFVTAAEFRASFQPKDFKFNLFGGLQATPGGQVSVLDVSVLPSLQGNGIAQAAFVIQPCGINLPHIHPRATEIQTLIKGNDVLVGFVDENGNRGRPTFNVLKQGESTFYPQGLVHFQFNSGCKPVTLLSSLNNEDPGVLTVLSNLFQEGVDVAALSTSLGIDDTILVQDIIENIPRSSPAQAVVQSCLNKCYGNSNNYP